MLKVNRSLRVLDLGGACIGDSGTSLIAEAVAVNNTLNKLYLYENQYEKHKNAQ
jgi:hypothetical protein